MAETNQLTDAGQSLENVTTSTQPDPVEGWSFVPRGFIIPHASYRSVAGVIVSLTGNALFVGREEEADKMHLVPFPVLAALLPTQQFELMPLTRVKPPTWFEALSSRPVQGWSSNGAGAWEDRSARIQIDVDARGEGFLTVVPPVGTDRSHVPLQVVQALFNQHGLELASKAALDTLRQDLRDTLIGEQREHMRADANALDLRGEISANRASVRTEIADFLEQVAATLGEHGEPLRQCALKVRDESYVALLDRTP